MFGSLSASVREGYYSHCIISIEKTSFLSVCIDHFGAVLLLAYLLSIALADRFTYSNHIDQCLLEHENFVLLISHRFRSDEKQLFSFLENNSSWFPCTDPI